jgi:F-type H+-transporting ATPase subunit b
MRNQANAEAARITESAKRQIEAERQQAVVQLRQEVGTMSTALASKIVGESLEDEVRQKGIVDRFLAELESGAVTPEKVGSQQSGPTGADL